MQARHRRTHHRVWLILGPLLLVGVVVGLLARPPLPILPAPAEAAAATPTGAGP